MTLDLTEKLYKGSSTKVKKTDYLRNRTAVEGLRAANAQMEGSERLALAALTNVLGLDWDAEIDVSEPEIPFRPNGEDLRSLVSGRTPSTRTGSGWKRESGAAEAQVEEKESGTPSPPGAVRQGPTRIENSYQPGARHPGEQDFLAGRDRHGTSDLPRVPHAERGAGGLGAAREDPPAEGPAQGGDRPPGEGRLPPDVERSREQRAAMSEAARSAEENRDLNERAYRDEFVETKDVIEAQLVESFTKAGSEKTLYDHAEAQARLEFLVGREIEALLR